MRLVELLKRHEGKTLEYKRDLSSQESILKCLVAFANTGGGIVVIGVEDGSKNVRGVTEHQGRQVPTIGGLLLFGKDRFARFPDAWIQAGRFAGTNRTRLLD